MILSFVLALSVLGSSGAQAPGPKKPDNTFITEEECNAALKSRNFRYYEPQYRGLNKKNPVNGEDRIIVPLETDMCFRMRVVGGKLFVVQHEGTKFRANKLSDGSLELYARDDCGNEVYGVTFSAPTPPPAPSKTRSLASAAAEATPPPEHQRTSASLATDAKKHGFCHSTKCKVLVIGGVLVAGGAAAAYYWPCPCPPGTICRK